MDRPHRPLLVVLLALVAALAAACGPAASSPGPSAAASPTPGQPAITTPDQAVERILEQNPDLRGIGPKDPDMIGGCCFYEVTEDADGYQVTFEVGWGDCMAGCINRHRWTYAVARGGEVQLREETGDPLPPGGIPAG